MKSISKAFKECATNGANPRSGDVAQGLALFSVFLLAAAGMPSSAHATTTDYIVQKVCVNQSDVAVYGDPYNCPAGTSLRKLRVGESLPYHKIDYRGIQISDSFPINDKNGVSRAVQSYFYVSSFGTDAKFPPNANGKPSVFLNYKHGGYNIIGASNDYVFFRGTYDNSGGWQPWWTSNCEAAGWRLFPNAPTPLAYGYAPSPTINLPNCNGTPPTPPSEASVEWNSTNFTYKDFTYKDFTYMIGKTIPTIYDFNFAADSSTFEANYFTEIYGVTRWEAWHVEDSKITAPGAAAIFNCPNSNFTAVVRGRIMHMQDCREWATIYKDIGPWDPNARSPVDPSIVAWPVDPLYTGVNLLINTHMGGTTASRNPTEAKTCDHNPWQRSYTTPGILHWGWAPEPEMGTDYFNCILQFAVPGTPNGEVLFQQKNVSNLSGIHSYGLTLWTPNNSSGAARVQIIQRDAAGGLTGSDYIIANADAKPHTFSGEFAMQPTTATVYFAIYPLSGNVAFNFTGAWISIR